MKFYKTPDSILKRQLELYDEIAKKYMATNPLFKEIIAVAARVRQAGDAVGAGLHHEPQDGVRSLLRTEREVADLTAH